MKKYTYMGSKWLLMGMVLPILMFFFAMNSVYAYFTATAAPRNGSVSTGSIKIIFNSDSLVSLEGDVITLNGETVNIPDDAVSFTNVLPGQTIYVEGTIKNTGTNELYNILKMDIVIGEETETVYYTTSGTVFTGLSYNEQTEKYSGAQILAANKVVKFALPYTFDFYKYGNDFYNKEIKINLTARGIQTVHITQDIATEELINME